MEIRQLGHFIAIVDAGSVKDAARKLGVRQPSLSQSLARLEDDVGDALFDRLGSGMSLTRTGELLVPRAREMLALAADAKRSIRADLDEGIGCVAVGAIPTVAPYVIPDAIRSFRDRFPRAEIDFREESTADLVNAVARAEIEVALIASDVDDDRVKCEQIGQEKLLLAMPDRRELVDAERLCHPQLKEAGVLILSEIHCLGDQARTFCEHQGIDKVIRIQTGQLTTLLSLVRCGLGITLVPEMCVRSESTVGIVCRRLYHDDPSRPVSLIWHAQRTPSDLARAFARVVRNQVLHRLCSSSESQV